MPRVLFGIDHHDRLVLTWESDQYQIDPYRGNFFKWFHNKLVSPTPNWMIHFFNGTENGTSFERLAFTKNDNYNLEDSVKEATDRFDLGERNLYYILKDRKWYKCGLKTDYCMVRCEGEYTDLTNTEI